ncbi:hypothetical protein MASR2M78_26820 [Treponema sp.]
MPVTRILLDEIAEDGEREHRLSAFDLILTSARHYSELLGMAPSVRDKIVQVALSPSQETIIALASIKPNQRLGIICQSRQFREIIQNKLHDFMIDEGVQELDLDNEEAFPAFIEDKDLIIVPPLWNAPTSNIYSAALQAFTGRGGRFLTFDYQVERGSMIYVEERVRDLLSQ